MKNKSDNSAKQEKVVEPKFKHFALAMLIIFSFTAPFFIITTIYWNKGEELLKSNSKETIAFYVYPAGSIGSKGYVFEYKINGERYSASLHKLPVPPPDCPFREIPMMVRYAVERPGHGFVLPEKEFNYKGYKIKWITHEKSYEYYMLIEKIE